MLENYNKSNNESIGNFKNENSFITKNNTKGDITNALDTIKKDQEFIREKATQVVSFPEPIVKWENRGIIYPNTINTVQGKTGTHKSRFVELICRVLLSPINLPLLGFNRTILDSKAYEVLYVDTERNQNDQFPYALQQIAIKSGFSSINEISNFDFISLIRIK